MNLAVALFLSFMPLAGVSPLNQWDCPATHPIKGNYTTYDGSRCIAHPPEGKYYKRTKPEVCFATVTDATVAGCRISER
jgi:hypothetical protein